MKRKQKDITIDGEKIFFSYTDRYLKKRKAIKNITPFVFVIAMFPYLYIIFTLFKDIWPFFIFSYIILGLIGVYKYGKPFSEYQKDDIFIQNNQIHLNKHTRLRFDSIDDCIRINKVTRVVVKKYTIDIYGDIFDINSNQPMVQKKLVFPKEIESVDEFIRIAKSMQS